MVGRQSLSLRSSVPVDNVVDMGSIAFVEATSVYEAVDALFDKIDALDSDALSNSERAELLERRQTWRAAGPPATTN